MEKPPAPPRRLHVATVSETYPPEINGVATTLGRMVEGLLGLGHRVQVIRPRQHRDDSPVEGARLQEVLAPGLPLPRYPGLRLGLPAKGRLLRLWSEQRPDVVHLVTEGPLAWSALAAARRLGLPVVSDFHTNFHQYSRDYGLGWLYRPIAGYLRGFHNRTDATLVPTAALQADLTEQGYANVRVVSRGVDTALFGPHRRSRQLRAAWGLAENAPAVLYVGRLAPEKNLPLALEAFAAIAALEPRARLVLVGDGPSRGELERAYPQHVFAGMRRGEDLAGHYASGDLFLFPSRTETFGNVTTEALASGLAVVAYEYAAAGELIIDGENGFLAPCGDAPAFIAAAARAIECPTRRAAVRRSARLTAECLDWNRVVADFVQVLHTVIAEHGRRRGAQHAPVLAAD